jgi:NAD(P)-dependent dehydrogenase (short-subunit alcohol dehydrogenase family)
VTNAETRAVVITGASTGIGRACAMRLDRAGWRVFAGVRKEADAESLREEASNRLIPVRIDVTNAASIEAAAETVGEALDARGLAGLLNNAGMGVGGPLEFLDMDDFRQQLEVNLIGQVAVTQAFLELIRAASGRILNMTSIGGRLTLPFLGPYSASKFGLEAVTNAFRQELQPWGIEVIAIEPGNIKTPIWDKATAETSRELDQLSPRGEELYGKRMASYASFIPKIAKQGIPADRVAQVVERALTSRRPKPRYVVGRDARLRLVLDALLPTRTTDRMIARFLGFD